MCKFPIIWQCIAFLVFKNVSEINTFPLKISYCFVINLFRLFFNGGFAVASAIAIFGEDWIVNSTCMYCLDADICVGSTKLTVCLSCVTVYLSGVKEALFSYGRLDKASAF